MNLTDIRKAFSKGNVSITENGICITYIFKGNIITQNFSDFGLRVLMSMAKTADSVDIACSKNHYISVAFNKQMKRQDSIFFPAIEKELTLQEIKEMSRSVSKSCNETTFKDFLIGTDLSNMDAVMDKFMEWSKELLYDEKKPVDISKLVRWKNLQKNARFLSTLFGGNYEEFPYNGVESAEDSKYAGGIELSLTNSNISFVGRVKDGFISALSASSECVFEMNVVNGSIYITLLA